MLFKAAMSPGESASPIRNESSHAALEKGGFPPHKCSLSVGLRYAPASSEAAFMRE